MLKETHSLISSGVVDNVLIGAIKDDATPEHEHIDGNREVWRIPLLSKSFRKKSTIANVTKLSEWSLKCTMGFLRWKVDVVQCHSLVCLPIGCFLKMALGATLIYDCHELETEHVGTGAGRKAIEKALEWALIRYADAIITVSEPIAEWYSNTYRLNNVTVIKNSPYRSSKKTVKSNFFQEAFGIPNDELIFLYSGMISKHRCSDLLLQVFAEMPPDRHIVFMGYGELEQAVKDYACRYKNIHFHHAVPQDQVVEYACSADVGMNIFKDISLSYRYSLPNKLYEYLLSSLPVVVSASSLQGDIISKWNCGWRVTPEREALLSFFRSITPEEIEAKRKFVIASQSQFGWEEEGQKLVELYRKLLAERRVESHHRMNKNCRQYRP